MKRIRWSKAAANDLEGINNYLRENHPSFAASTLRRLYDATKTLKQFLLIGRIGRKSGTRELVLVPLPYLLVNSVDEHAVNILRYLHTSQERT